MGLGIPGQVVRMLDGYNDQVALGDVVGEHRKVNVGMLPEETFAPGDWVIIHMGFVVEKTDKAGADEAMAGLELIGRGRSEPEGFSSRSPDRDLSNRRPTCRDKRSLRASWQRPRSLSFGEVMGNEYRHSGSREPSENGCPPRSGGQMSGHRTSGRQRPGGDVG